MCSDRAGGWAHLSEIKPSLPFSVYSTGGKTDCPPRSLGQQPVQYPHNRDKAVGPQALIGKPTTARHSTCTNLLILVPQRTAQPPEVPACHHGNAEQEGLKPAGCFNRALCTNAQGSRLFRRRLALPLACWASCN